MNYTLSCSSWLLRRFATISLLAIASVLFVQAQQDTTPPVLADFDFSPKQVDTSSGPADITLSRSAIFRPYFG